MKPASVAHVLGTGVAILALAALIQSQDREQPATAKPVDRIMGIVIRGNQRIPALEIRKMIPIKPGDVYDPAKVEATAATLKRSGSFDDVWTRVSDDPDGSRGGTMLIFQVHDRPTNSATLNSSQAAAQSSTACPVSETVMTEPAKAEGAGRFGYGAWYVNENRTIWVRNDSWQAGKDGNKVLWKKPVGTILRVVSKPLGHSGPEMHAGYRNAHYGFAILDLAFDSPGCWAISAEAGSEHLDFVTTVLPTQTRKKP
jgi:hypothetical protein